MKIHFWVYMDELTPELANEREQLISALAIHRPLKPIEKGCRLIVKWLFPAGKHKPGTYKMTKPDTDNLQKLLKDCMTQCGFWEDGALVVSETVEKLWSDIPGIHVVIEELEDDKQSII